MPRVNAKSAAPGFSTFTHRKRWWPRCTDQEVGYLSAKDRFASSCRNGNGWPGRRQTRRKSKYVSSRQPSLHASSNRENSPNVSAGTSVSSMTMDLRGHRRLIFLRVASMASGGERAVGGLFFDFGPIRTASSDRDAPHRCWTAHVFLAWSLV